MILRKLGKVLTRTFVFRFCRASARVVLPTPGGPTSSIIVGLVIVDNELMTSHAH